MTDTFNLLADRIRAAVPGRRGCRIVERLAMRMLALEERGIPAHVAYRVAPGVLEVLIASPSGRVTARRVSMSAWASLWSRERRAGRVRHLQGRERCRPVLRFRRLRAALRAGDAGSSARLSYFSTFGHGSGLIQRTDHNARRRLI